MRLRPLPLTLWPSDFLFGTTMRHLWYEAEFLNNHLDFHVQFKMHANVKLQRTQTHYAKIINIVTSPTALFLVYHSGDVDGCCAHYFQLLQKPGKHKFLSYHWYLFILFGNSQSGDERDSSSTNHIFLPKFVVFL